MDDPYTNVGKQVLHHGVHFADARDSGAAEQIVDALNHVNPAVPAIEQPTLFPIEPIGPLCRAYQTSDQMMCPCGLQWDINDPDPPSCGG